jgi:hypothetical protein
MKTLIQKTKYFRSIRSKVVMALILVPTISTLSLSSALADRDGEHHGRGDYDGYRYQRGYQQPYGYGYGNRQPYGYPQGYPQPYAYVQPAYVPPPVYYVPQQPPGISLVFPLIFNR